MTRKRHLIVCRIVGYLPHSYNNVAAVSYLVMLEIQSGPFLNFVSFMVVIMNSWIDVSICTMRTDLFNVSYISFLLSRTQDFTFYEQRRCTWSMLPVLDARVAHEFTVISLYVLFGLFCVLCCVCLFSLSDLRPLISFYSEVMWLLSLKTIWCQSKGLPVNNRL